MFTWNWIKDTLSFSVVLISCTFFTASGMPRRKYFVIRVIVCLLLFASIIIAVRAWFYCSGIVFGNPLEAFDFFIQYIAAIFMVLTCFGCNFWAALFCATVGYLLEHLSNKIFEMLQFSVLGAVPELPLRLIQIAIIAGVCIGIYFLIMRKSHFFGSPVMVDNKMQTLAAVCIVAVVTFGTSFLICYVFEYGDSDLMANMRVYLSFISVVFAFVGILLEFSMRSVKAGDNELAVIKNILRGERERYEKEKAGMELINMKCHDLRHQIAACGGKLEDGELESIARAIDIYDSGIDTSNDAANVIINEKSLVCRAEGIKLTCMLDGRSLDALPKYEIYSLLGNALENAINAVKKLEPEKRVISITSTGTKGMFCIHIENYFHGDIVFDGGLPVTNKDTDYHGYGMKSMRYIAEQYGGALRSYVSGDIFVLDIILPSYGM